MPIATLTVEQLMERLRSMPQQAAVLIEGEACLLDDAAGVELRPDNEVVIRSATSIMLSEKL